MHEGVTAEVNVSSFYSAEVREGVKRSAVFGR